MPAVPVRVVVNGSPTKTEILDESKGRTQVANLTMAFIALLVTLFLTALLANMPEAVLGAIVFLIGLGLVDYLGLRHILRLRRSEGVIALITAVVVCVVGVEQGIVLAVVMSIIWLIRRQYRPEAFILKSGLDVVKDYVVATGGQETLPGLIVFRYDADLFFANASRFVDDVEGVFDTAPTPVRLFVLDCSVISDVDYSARSNTLSAPPAWLPAMTAIKDRPTTKTIIWMKSVTATDHMPP